MIKKRKKIKLSREKINSYLKIVDKYNYNIKTNEDILIFDELISTNTQAKEILKKEINISKEKIKIIIAEKQKKGRGRRGNNWFSNNDKGLWVSFVFNLDLPREEIPQITIIGALAVQKTLGEYNINSKIKWPNDVLVNGKKIAGILTEMLIVEKSNIPAIIMGIGLNVNQNKFLENISQTATSIFNEKNIYLDKNEVFSFLFTNFIKLLHEYSSVNRKKLIEIWKKELNLIGKKVKLNHNKKEYKVLILDILNNGELLCKLKNGKTKTFPTFGTSLNFESIKKLN